MLVLVINTSVFTLISVFPLSNMLKLCEETGIEVTLFRPQVFGNYSRKRLVAARSLLYMNPQTQCLHILDFVYHSALKLD